MLSAVIIDDDEISIRVLETLLNKLDSFDLKIVGIAHNLAEGVELIKEKNPEIVFLDIEMPLMNGLEIYNYFQDPFFKIIFVTSHPQYSLEALKKSASDYLLKPVDIFDLQEAIVKVIREIEKEHQKLMQENKVNYLTNIDVEGKDIIFEIENGFIVENTRNIEYCYADESYSYVVTYFNKKLQVTKPLCELQEMLPQNQFYRTHKSYLVNVHFIINFVKAGYSYVELKSGVRIPVSVRKSTTISKDIKQLLTV